MTLEAEGRRFVQELRRSRRARQEAHQTIAIMPGGLWGGRVGGPLLGHDVTAWARCDVEQQIDRYYDAAITAHVLRPPGRASPV